MFTSGHHKVSNKLEAVGLGELTYSEEKAKSSLAK